MEMVIDSSGRMDTPNRRAFMKGTGSAVAVGLVAGCLGGGGANGSNGSGNFPNRPVTLIIPYSSGGGYNYYTRLVAKYISQEDYLPVEVQPQNVTGGGGVVGHNRLYNAEPNGYTDGIVNPDSMAKAQAIRDEAQFKLQDMTYYPRAAGRIPAVGVGDHVDLSSGEEFIRRMANDELTVGHSGVTSTGSIIPVAIGIAGDRYAVSNVLNNAVQFSGKSQWITAIKREEVDVMCGSHSSLLPFVRAGDLKITLVATRNEEPPEETPDASTLQDVDVADPQEIISIAGGQYHRTFAGPPGIPEERATVIREAIREAIQNEALQQEASDNNRPVNFASSQKAKDAITEAVNTWQNNKDLLRELIRRGQQG